MNNKENDSKDKNIKIHTINIFGTRLSLLALLILIAGFILSIVNYKNSLDIKSTIILLIIYFTFTYNTNCMLLGDCFYTALLYLIGYIIITIFILLNMEKIEHLLEYHSHLLKIFDNKKSNDI
jgi:vacuolar-type H+-ATPase subunit I/STV1